MQESLQRRTRDAVCVYTATHRPDPFLFQQAEDLEDLRQWFLGRIAVQVFEHYEDLFQDERSSSSRKMQVDLVQLFQNLEVQRYRLQMERIRSHQVVTLCHAERGGS